MRPPARHPRNRDAAVRRKRKARHPLSDKPVTNPLPGSAVVEEAPGHEGKWRARPSHSQGRDLTHEKSRRDPHLARAEPDEAVRTGCNITRIALVFEAGRDGFWLDLWHSSFFERYRSGRPRHVQEGDGLDGASEAMLQARRYVCDSEGSRAAALEAEPGGVVPSERAEIQVRFDRATGAGELVKFGQLVWYRFSFKIAGDWPRDVPVAGRQTCRTVIHQIKQDSFKDGKSCNASPFFKIEARPLGERVRFFAQVATGM